LGLDAVSKCGGAPICKPETFSSQVFRIIDIKVSKVR
jgi:hypothetical protein